MPKKVTLPALPPVSLTPMTAERKRELINLIRSLKEQNYLYEVQEFVKKCCALIWIDLCLQQGFKPPTASSKRKTNYHTILPLFVKATIGLSEHGVADYIEDYHAPYVAIAASEMWQEEAAKRTTAQPKLPGISEDVLPPYARVLAGGVQWTTPSSN